MFSDAEGFSSYYKNLWLDRNFSPSQSRQLGIHIQVKNKNMKWKLLLFPPSSDKNIYKSWSAEDEEIKAKDDSCFKWDRRQLLIVFAVIIGYFN